MFGLTRIAIRALPTILILLAIAGSTYATAYYVSPGGSNSNDCLSVVTTCQTIQGAINKTSNGDSISVASGTYSELVQINDRANLRLSGGPLTVLTFPAGPLGPSQPLVEI